MRKKKKKLIGSYAAISAKTFAANMRLISNLEHIEGGKIKNLMIGQDIVYGLWLDMQYKFSVSSQYGIAQVEEGLVDRMLESFNISNLKDVFIKSESIENGLEIEIEKIKEK